ncbi:hypothetical protein F3Y22_tig00116939pilonHSYRG00279 [Hibiscus syriacus]|uniref:Uncharacterized protein n=1 Tax=Hibiscus syriacus TaxID=106335 RepID=A0A6A2Y0Q9_HIBSY|nr:hypothetical protein F3Y22_tig00116939pilonHSYRG00279 [Hibiscus syriacus]
MEGLIPFVYRAIVQYKNGKEDHVLASWLNDSPSASYTRLPTGDSGRFQISDERVSESDNYVFLHHLPCLLLLLLRLFYQPEFHLQPSVVCPLAASLRDISSPPSMEAMKKHCKWLACLKESVIFMYVW